MTPPEQPFRILTVCTGNICRSPMAERLLQAGLDEVCPGEFEVRSAGTHAMVGWDMQPQVQGLVHVLGGNTEGFEARLLTPQILQGQDLVLAMTREHRSAVVGMAPTLLRRTFTLREFARILPHVTPEGMTTAERWKSIFLPAARIRTRVTVPAEEDNIIDPYRHDEVVYQEMMRQLAPAARSIISWAQSVAPNLPDARHLA
ncbi:low molecular weight phosphatase family protein [Paenarthrobacter sp. DKR-5]|nr:low molecular weight phosphatase family protein [Paenarthrobacter sp. DKR-5]